MKYLQIKHIQANWLLYFSLSAVFLYVLLTSNAIAEGSAKKNVESTVNLEKSVVKVFSTLRGPDPFKPWAKAAPQEVTGSGVVIEGKRILTNAHVVEYASQVQIQNGQDGNKVAA